jgi:hypothetical protein
MMQRAKQTRTTWRIQGQYWDLLTELRQKDLQDTLKLCPINSLHEEDGSTGWGEVSLALPAKHDLVQYFLSLVTADRGLVVFVETEALSLVAGLNEFDLFDQSQTTRTHVEVDKVKTNKELCERIEKARAALDGEDVSVKR